MSNARLRASDLHAGDGLVVLTGVAVPFGWWVGGADWCRRPVRLVGGRWWLAWSFRSAGGWAVVTRVVVSFGWWVGGGGFCRARPLRVAALHPLLSCSYLG